MWPADLREWTFATVLGVVEAHEYEPGEFDYKGALKGSAELATSIQRTACSLANTLGGWIR